jgi:hypothetical protein
MWTPTLLCAQSGAAEGRDRHLDKWRISCCFGLSNLGLETERMLDAQQITAITHSAAYDCYHVVFSDSISSKPVAFMAFIQRHADKPSQVTLYICMPAKLPKNMLARCKNIRRQCNAMHNTTPEITPSYTPLLNRPRNIIILQPPPFPPHSVTLPRTPPPRPHPRP